MELQTGLSEALTLTERVTSPLWHPQLLVRRNECWFSRTMALACVQIPGCPAFCPFGYQTYTELKPYERIRIGCREYRNGRLLVFGRPGFTLKFRQLGASCCAISMECSHIMKHTCQLIQFCYRLLPEPSGETQPRKPFSGRWKTPNS